MAGEEVEGRETDTQIPSELYAPPPPPAPHHPLPCAVPQETVFHRLQPQSPCFLAPNWVWPIGSTSQGLEDGAVRVFIPYPSSRGPSPPQLVPTDSSVTPLPPLALLDPGHLASHHRWSWGAQHPLLMCCPQGTNFQSEDE